MEKSSDIESKYQKLATEYSKVRSQATVLKKAVLDEQAKNSQLNELIRKHEQTIRKHDQEMESLTFRNEQLTKRISVLQQELQINSHGKKGKHRPAEETHSSDTGVLNEELQKKILENAQLLSSIADKDLELTENKQKIDWLEARISDLEKESETNGKQYEEKIHKLVTEKETLGKRIKEYSINKSNEEDKAKCDSENVAFWKNEAEKWKSECEILRSKPKSNEELIDYYESQISEILETKFLALSETKSLWAENLALNSRLENLTLEHNELQNKLDQSYEELVTTNENYKNQLDAMTEHLAAQNEKITQQCDEIQHLKHKLATKK